MFVEDIRHDFYDVLLGNRVLLLVHYDVDAVCTCKILQDLFKSDNISYTLVPVGGFSELKTAYEENCEEIKYVVLVNCGGTVDLVDILQPEEDVVFFVLDSHKPTDVCNVYSDGQVRLVHKDSEENIPSFDDIFRDDEEEQEEMPTEGGREALEAAVERRRARRLWEDNRHTLLFNYTQFSYYGKPAAKVILEKDVCLPLYRVWSLEAALRHAPALGPHLALHTRAGEDRLRQLLADMGFPLSQARESYRAMDVSLRRALAATLSAAAPRHRLPPPDHAAFLLQRPHSPTVAALDLVFAIMALIEHETMPKGEGFQHALSALDIQSGDNASLRLGVTAARQALEAVSRLAQGTLAARRLLLAGPFSYFIVQQGTPEAKFVRGPLWLGVTARWTAAAAGGARPLVALAPRDHAHCLVLGVPPKHDAEPRNLFGAAFEQAAAKSGTRVSLEYPDSAVVALPDAQRKQFMDALTALLA